MSEVVGVKDLKPGDLIEWPLGRRGLYEAQRLVRVVEVVTRAEVDWTDRSRAFAATAGTRTFEPERVLVVVDGGKRFHCCFPANYYQGLISRVSEHHAVCAECGGYWPCQHEFDDLQLAAFRHELDDACECCGQPIGARHSVMFGGPHLDIPGQMGARFHSAKRFAACRAAAARYRLRWQARQAERADEVAAP